MLTHPLLPKLRQLKLSGMLLTLDTRAAQALDRQLSPTEFLALLLDDELERRNQQSLARRLKLSGCDEHKTLARFDFTAAPASTRLAGAPARPSNSLTAALCRYPQAARPGCAFSRPRARNSRMSSSNSASRRTASPSETPKSSPTAYP